MALAVDETTVGTATSTTSVATSTTITAASDMIYVAFVAVKGGSPTFDSISGGGLTWTKRDTACGGRGITESSLWTATGTPSGDFIATCSLGATVDAAGIIVAKISGGDTTTPMEDPVYQNTNGEDGACSGGSDDTDVDGPTTTSTIANSMHLVGLTTRSASIDTNDPNYTEQDSFDAGTGGNRVRGYLQTYIKTATGDDLYNATISTNNDWNAGGMIIRAGAAGGDGGLLDAGTFRGVARGAARGV